MTATTDPSVPVATGNEATAPPTGGGGRRTRRDRCCRQAGVGGDHRLCGVGEGRSGGRDLAREHLPGMWLRHPRSGVLLLVQPEATVAQELRAAPAIPGIERFQGEVFHSARWDHELA